MRRLVPVLLGLALLAAPGPACADISPAAMAQALKGDPVVVDPELAETVDAAAAGRIRVRIAERAIGRLKVAVIPKATHDAVGGIGTYANTVAAAAQVRGALLVTSGSDWFVVTSYPRDAEAAEAVRTAVAGDGADDPLEARILRAVEGLAVLDPGAAADLGVTPGEGVEIDLGGIGDTIRWVLIGLAVAIGAPFLVVALLLTARSVRRARGAVEDRAEALTRARERLLALGDGLRELDELESAPGAAAEGRAAYGVVLDRYDKADALLDPETPSARAVRNAGRVLGEAEAALTAARAALGAPVHSPAL